jgi:hypothetical protein
VPGRGWPGRLIVVSVCCAFDNKELPLIGRVILSSDYPSSNQVGEDEIHRRNHTFTCVGAGSEGLSKPMKKIIVVI